MGTKSIVNAFTMLAALTCSSFSLAQTESAVLYASDASAVDNFGWTTAIGGPVAVVGSWLADPLGSNSGAVYVYRRNGTDWVQEAKLTAPDGAKDDEFGWSVAVDGDVIVVGANGNDDSGDWTGAVYVFRYVDANWTFEQKLLADGIGYYWEEFGYAVDVSGDTIVVGASKANDMGTKAGAAYVFRHDPNGWEQEAKLLASDGAENAIFGCDVAIDGETVLVGAHQESAVIRTAGAVYVFRQNESGHWQEMQKIMASDASHGLHLGRSVEPVGRLPSAAHTEKIQHVRANIYCNSGAAIFSGLNGTSWG